MNPRRGTPWLATLGAILLVNAARAQRTDTAGKPAVADPRDSVFLRARGLVLQGNGAAGRALVDSQLTATAGTPEYANALYWRAALSATAADAERGYRQVIVEYPFSRHSGDALLALAQLEMARGDRDPAIDHLQRFLLQHPNDPEKVRVGIWLGRLLLEQNQLVKGCAVLLRTRAALGDTAVETRNQIDYYASRCADVDTIPVVTRPTPPARAQHVDSTVRRRPGPRDSARPDTARRAAPRRDSVRPDTNRARRSDDAARKEPARRDTAKPNANRPAETRYTVQVAAYQTRDSAEQLVTKLGARGIIARIAGTKPPFRVRIGHYATDADARAAARELKDKGIDGFITTTDVERATATVRP